MSIYRGAYVGAKACTKGPTPGALALEAWFLGAYRDRGARNDGVFNCRPVRGSTRITSVHGEGRAADLGCAAGDGWAQTLADALVAYSNELGIQCVIFNRRIWSCAHPDAGWRPYTGVDHHTTHLHVELTWAAARTLTAARVRAVLTPGDDLMADLKLDEKQLGAIAGAVLDHPVTLTDAAARAIGGEMKAGDTVSVRYLLQWPPLARRILNDHGARLSAIEEILATLTARPSGVGVALTSADLAAIAKAVNDDAATRMVR